MQFGPYELKSRIGTGGMGEVFLAQQSMSHGVSRRVVIKRVLPHLSFDPRFGQVFVQEAQVLARLSHPNIATLFDFGVIDGSYYLAIEHLDGFDLSLLLNQFRDPIPIDISIRLVMDVASALQHAHEVCDEEGRPLHVIHRDVTPSNLFLCRNGRIKVLDFGIAKTSNNDRNTTTGVLKGKYGYFAPEQLKMLPIDRRVDVFALGIVTYELLTRVHPFRREGEFQTLQSLADDTPALASSFGVAEAFDAVLMKALEKLPEQRFASMDEFSSALLAAAQASGISAATDQRIAQWLAQLPIKQDAAKPVEHMGDKTRASVNNATRTSGVREAEAIVVSPSSAPPPPVDPPPLPTKRDPLPPPPTLRQRMLPLVIGASVVAVAAGTGLTFALTRSDPKASVAPPTSPNPSPSPPSAPSLVAAAAQPASAPAPSSPATTLTQTDALPAAAPKKASPPTVSVTSTPKKGALKLVLNGFGAELYVDGQALDDGPPWKAPAFTLAAGKHTVRLLNADAKIDVSLPIVIVAGKTFTLELSQQKAQTLSAARKPQGQ